MTNRERAIEAVRAALEPVDEPMRQAFDKAAAAIRALPIGTFADEWTINTDDDGIKLDAGI